MRKLLFLLVFLIISVNLSAQVKVRPGIKIGLNLSNISNTTLDYKGGLLAGAFVNIRFSEIYALQPEILYSSQGGKNGNSDLDIQYISIGISNKIFVAKNQGFHFLFGPGIDINLENNFINLTDDEFNFDNDFAGVDFTLFAGLGYEFDFGLILETRFKQGLINVDLFAEDFDFYEQGNVLNQVFQFSAAYKFDW